MAARPQLIYPPVPRSLVQCAVRLTWPGAVLGLYPPRAQSTVGALCLKPPRNQKLSHFKIFLSSPNSSPLWVGCPKQYMSYRVREAYPNQNGHFVQWLKTAFDPSFFSTTLQILDIRLTFTFFFSCSSIAPSICRKICNENIFSNNKSSILV